MTSYLKEAHIHGIHDLADLYELVQYAGNIIPRLYLMITIGSVFMSLPDAPVKEIMKDMIEMAKGVQHPTRGLFLRHYLSGMTKDYLPIGDSDGLQGNLSDSISFTLENFVEMNKLWVRLQHQGHSRERSKREAERKELRTLVGTNLVRLSQLEGMNLELYKSRILPELLEQIINCKDLIAQEYLMEAIIQVFQDDFHLRTLTPFLASIANLHPQLSAKGIVISFIDRLAAYASREAENEENEEIEEENIINEDQKTLAEEEGENATPVTTKKQEDKVKTHRGIPEDVKLFEVLWKQVIDLIEARKEIPFDDITALLVSSANLAISCYPDNLEYFDQVLTNAKERYIALEDSPDAQSTTALANLLSLLKAPIEAYPDLLTLLKLKNYLDLYKSQPYESRRTIANTLITGLLKRETLLINKVEVDGVLDVISVLLKDQDDGGIRFSRMFGDISKKLAYEKEEKYVTELTSVARLLNLIHNENSDVMLELLKSAFTFVIQGDVRVKFTLPPLIHSGIKLLRINALKEEKPEDPFEAYRSIFSFLHNSITNLYNKTEGHDITFRLFLASALAADELNCEAQAYDFFVEAFTYYEECISESKAQYEAILLLIGSLHSTRSFGAENYDNLATKCVLHAGKLLKKPDQCRALSQASRLFWVVATPQAQIPGSDQLHLPLLSQREENLYREGKRVLETLQRALKIADGVMDPLRRFELFVELIQHYLYHFRMGCNSIEARYINGLFEITRTHLDNLELENESNNGIGYQNVAPDLAFGLSKSSVLDMFQRCLQQVKQLKQNPPKLDYHVDFQLLEPETVDF
ncbi:vacuolar protein sorting-associated protein 35 [Neoconidiobolus thromboides FSU 785]|nr:vacuolar protein sorting-associated protein 35 [Neoconidiobolus thromboides FSU 785]